MDIKSRAVRMAIFTCLVLGLVMSAPVIAQEEGGSMPAKKQEGGEEKKTQEGEGSKKEGEGAKKEGEKEGEGAKKSGEGEKKEGEATPSKKRRKKGEGAKEGEGAKKDGEGDKPRKEGEGAKKDGEDEATPGAKKKGDAPAGDEDKPAPKTPTTPTTPATPSTAAATPSGITVDDKVVSADGKKPDVAGRVVSVYQDGKVWLITIKVPKADGTTQDTIVYMVEDTSAAYTGTKDKSEEKPTAGFMGYAWLKANSKDTAASIRFVAEAK